jgi:hypothetical protein
MSLHDHHRAHITRRGDCCQKPSPRSQKIPLPASQPDTVVFDLVKPTGAVRRVLRTMHHAEACQGNKWTARRRQGTPEGSAIQRHRDQAAGASPSGSSSRPISPSPSIQFRWLIIFALGPRRRVDARPQSRKTCVGPRSKVREHLFIVSFDLGENFIDPRKHSADNLDHLAPQGVELDAQLLYVPLALFTTTLEIAHAPPSYPTSSRNCSNKLRRFSGGPLVPSLISGVTV